MDGAPTSGRSTPSDANPDAIVGALFEDARLARAAAMGVPAFVRRAQAVEAARSRLLATVAGERSNRLRWLMRTARVLERGRRRGDELPPAVLDILSALRDEPTFSGRTPPAPRSLRRTLKEFAVSVARFNRSWRKYLDTVSLSELHSAQEKYNRYYALEKEMALRGLPPRPFVPMPLFEREELAREFAPLPDVEPR